MHKKLICKRNPILSVAEKLLIIKLIRYIYLYIFLMFNGILCILLVFIVFFT